MSLSPLRFDNSIDRDFSQVLKTRVNVHFRENEISKSGNVRLYIKSITLIALFFTPLVLMLCQCIDFLPLYFLLWIIMGVAMAGIGMCIMHDAIHGAFSESPAINKILGLTLNLIGGNAFVWYMQHNVLHHTYPNVHETDDDLDIPVVLRMSPHQPRFWFHKYQHIYIWLLYAFATLFWVTSKDFVMLKKQNDRGLLKGKNEFSWRLLDIVFWKIIYFGYLLVLPIILLPIPTWIVVLMFVSMHLTGGILLSLIFQPAHVFQGSEFMEQNEGSVNKSWSLYQMETTTNFGLNKFLTWLAGGLNYQIEHHLFPHISHVHYPAIAPIVKETAEEFGMPYHQQKTLWGALSLHGRALRNLGSGNPIKS